MRKKSTGRKKIDIKLLETEEKKQVTFSKRRVGLMTKASELCVLCGAQIAIFVTSPKKQRVYAFGHPSTQAVIDRFLCGDAFSSGRTQDYPLVHEYSRQLAASERELEEEKRTAAAAAAIRDRAGEAPVKLLWEVPIEEMGVEELQQYAIALEEMKGKVWKRLHGTGGGRGGDSTRGLGL